MRSKENSKRKITQWIAYAIVMLTLAIRLVLLLSGLSQNLSLTTLDTITWTGFAIGVILLLVSYLFPEKK
ncbi:hypothetical protein SAMN05192533_1364 [Mesobacillus persicus]|uniref:Uncharacterized protein n=1 Tax=Mesobacillus persicus TaxID=930146 RepID=A0A1H8KYV5_9BACI|nr:hypothetical protein SAMN05192533_1364 [Mesobacillus persicus]